MMRHAKTLLAFAAVLSLPACISFGSEPPPSLLTLESNAPTAPGSGMEGDLTSALVVQQPTAAKKVNTTRVPVQIDTNNVAYLKDTAWVEKPDKLIQRLLAETIAAQTGRLVVDPYIAAGRQAQTLEGELIEFGIDKQSMEAVMVYDAYIVGNGSAVRKKRFEAREPVSKIDPEFVGVALSEAANSVAQDVAAWVQ